MRKLLIGCGLLIGVPILCFAGLSAFGGAAGLFMGDTVTNPTSSTGPATRQAPTESDPGVIVETTLTGQGVVDGDFLMISGTATNLPQFALVEMVATGSNGHPETLHLFVKEGTFETPLSLPNFGPGPVEVRISAHTDDEGHIQISTGELTASGELGTKDGPVVISEPVTFTVER